MRAIFVSMILGLAISMASIAIEFVDDPIPLPGTSYRGLPLAWLEARPMLGAVSTWTFDSIRRTSVLRPVPLIVDIAFWGGMAYCVVFLPLRKRAKTLESLRRRRGLCVKCGYNLTDNTTGVCPECGTKCGPKPPRGGITC